MQADSLLFEPSGKPQNIYVVLQRAFIYIGCICLFITMLLLCSVTQLCLTLCDPMDCSRPDFSVLHDLLELAQTDVRRVGDAIQSSYSLSSLLLPSIFPSIGVFSKSLLFASGGQSIGALALVLPMNIQGSLPLGLTSLISLQSKGLSRVFSKTTVQKHQFFGAQPSLWSNYHIHA